MAHTLLNAASATGAGNTQRVSLIPSQHTVQATMGGTVVATAVTVDLEGSLDDTTWVQLARHAFSAGGTAPTVTVKYEPVLQDRG
jgi:hypothetical protein